MNRQMLSAILAFLAASLITSCGSSVAGPAANQTLEARPTPSPSAEVPQGTQLVQQPAFVAPVWDYRVVDRFPHDRSAFTQGLVYRGQEELWESTGLVGKSSLRRVQIQTGKVLQKVDIPEPYFAEGLCYFQDQLFLLTWQNHQLFLCSPQTLQRTKKLAYDRDGWGITEGISKDGKKLLLTSDGSEEICWRDPGTLKTLTRVKVTDGTRPVYNLNELEWIEGQLWANVWGTPYVAVIDPHTGKVQAWVDFRGLLSPQESQGCDVLNGIAYDSHKHRIFVTGKLWPKLFLVEIDKPN